MSKEFKRNCNSCKRCLFGGCEVLNNNDEYKRIKDKGFFDTGRFKFKENFICENYKSRYIEYPIEVNKINNNCKNVVFRNSEVGKFVEIRPCEEKLRGKTFLGIYLGDLPIGTCVSYNGETKEVDLSFNNNPAIFVFDLNKIVYGYESWWKVIEKEEDLKDISDIDIDNVWYVKALKSIRNE